MTDLNIRMARLWSQLGTSWLPFADVATAELPMSRLLRLSLFQVSVGMAAALLIGTLNRVMIVELHVPAWLVATMVALPLVFAPARALIGFRSDHHRSMLGWRRVPYIWMGTLIQFGGLAIMPFALLVLSGDTHGPLWVGKAGAALAFLMLGAGMHTTQTVGLALATDLVPEKNQPRIVAMLCVMLMLGMIVSSVLFGWLLRDFSQVKLIQVIQGAALATLVLNVVALWKQEARDPDRTRPDRPEPSFTEAWRAYAQGTRAARTLVAVALGTAAFSMQDILLEPYGGQVLRLTVGQTTLLTAVLAAGGVLGFLLAARWLLRGVDPFRVAGLGIVIGTLAFSAVIFSAPLLSVALYASGAFAIGFGGGLFAHATLTAAMVVAPKDQVGLALGTWSAVQATAAGVAIAVGGLLRDLVTGLVGTGVLGPALDVPATGYLVVYHLEIALLFATLVALGPLVRTTARGLARPSSQYELSQFPG